MVIYNDGWREGVIRGLNGNRKKIIYLKKRTYSLGGYYFPFSTFKVIVIPTAITTYVR